jgi:hypothetical protein
MADIRFDAIVARKRLVSAQHFVSTTPQEKMSERAAISRPDIYHTGKGQVQTSQFADPVPAVSPYRNRARDRGERPKKFALASLIPFLVPPTFSTMAPQRQS